VMTCPYRQSLVPTWVPSNAGTVATRPLPVDALSDEVQPVNPKRVSAWGSVPT
jgi:hypothetical protein